MGDVGDIFAQLQFLEKDVTIGTPFSGSIPIKRGYLDPSSHFEE